MKAAKIVAIALVSYVGIVVVFESLIGFLQPASGDTLVITTSGADGAASDRVLSRIENSGKLYVAANHWPRAWYEQALANPDIEIAIDGQKTARRAVPVTGDEHDRIEASHGLPLPIRILTGFPPRYFLRLDPR